MIYVRTYVLADKWALNVLEKLDDNGKIIERGYKKEQ
jgi:hypothetical protein